MMADPESMADDLLAAARLEAAVEALAQWVVAQGGGDERYFRNQLPRYRRAMARIQALQPPPCRVLDIGSHYLHQSVLLSQLGYQVTGIDIALFCRAPFVQERALWAGIQNVTVDALEAGDFLPGQDGSYRLIVFTEILEHITFNPIRMWKRVYELLAPGGMVYVSTPNSLRLAAWLRELLRLVSFDGMGLRLDEIMGTVSYGHHWKEYSAREIRAYFKRLSPDFSVATSWYSSDLSQRPADFKTLLKRLLALAPCLRSDIEAVVRRTGDLGFSARAPELPMQHSATSGACQT